jgi:superoxide reductase
MATVSRYVDISTVDKEAKKDYIDRHSPFVHCETSAKKGEKFSVRVQMF